MVFILTFQYFIFLHHLILTFANDLPSPYTYSHVDNSIDNNNLAGRGPESRKMLSYFGRGNTIATGVIIVITLLNIVVNKLRQLYEENLGEKMNASSSSSQVSDQLCRRFSLTDILCATNNLDDSLVIGKGGFGKVYKGLIDNGLTSVAIKRLDPMSKQGAPEFWTEIRMLSKFRHSHLVSLIGYCDTHNEMILVYEYMVNGTLADHMHKISKDGIKSSLSWVQRLKICIGAARGLDYLHTGTVIQHRVIHRDVNSANILLNENWEAKISNFGLSKIGPAGLTYNVNVQGRFGYLDPEYVRARKLTRKSDVYAFGVVLFEVLCERRAVDLSLDEEQIRLAKWAQQCIKEGTVEKMIGPSLKCQILPNSLMEFVKIADQCLRKRPKKRPTMAKVIIRLESALELQVTTNSSVIEGDTINMAGDFDKKENVDSYAEDGQVNENILLGDLGGQQYLAKPKTTFTRKMSLLFHVTTPKLVVEGSRVVESSESDLGTIGITRENFSEANQLEQTFEEHRESDGGVEVQMQQMSLESTASSSTHLSSSLTWTSKQNKIFELALQLYDKNYPDRWQKVAAIVGDKKSVDDIKSHYEMHVLDLVNTKSDMTLMPSDALKPRNSKVIMTDQLNVSVGEFQQEVMKENPIWGEDEATRVTKTADIEFENLPDYLKKCILYCSVFPFGYEIQSDKLVQLWIAVGLIEAERTLELEDIGRLYFEILVCKEFILPFRYDNLVCQFKYKMNESMVVKGMPLGDYPRAEKGILGDASKMAKHLSLLSEDVGPTTFETLENYKHLQTLLLVHNFESSIRHIPRDLFLSLKLLRILDLSRTHISELPNSIGNLDSLRYLDISETPIIRLSDSVDRLQVLQTLKLNGCVRLHRLPKGMKKLISLRHLDLDIVRQLKSMPLGMGNLTNLQTLRAFLVSKEDGCGIGELKKLNKLRGSFRITGLENVLNPVEAREADLSNKHYLDKLELQWGNNIQDEKCEDEMEILECLQPHSGIKELKILFYKGLMLPSWISNPSFADIVSITLYKCLNCHLLPSVGELPSLKFLKLFEMNKVRYINRLFCRNQGNGGYRAFPKLEKLTLDVMLNLEEWTRVENGDFPCLLQLSIKHCPKIAVIPSLSHLSSLKHLELSHCTTLQSFPEEGLPASLEFLIVADCPGIKEQCKMAQVSNIWIDHQEISSN